MGNVCICLVTPFTPQLPGFCRSIHLFQFRIIIHTVLVCTDSLSRCNIFLIHVPDGIQRVPSAGGIGISQIQQLDIVASLLQKLGVEAEQLALWVCHDHAAAAVCCADQLNHRIDEGCRFTGTSSTDNQRMRTGHKITFQLSFFIQNCANRYTVLFHFTHRLIGKWREIFISFLIRQKAAVFQRAVLYCKIFTASQKSSHAPDTTVGTPAACPEHCPGQSHESKSCKISTTAQQITQMPLKGFSLNHSTNIGQKHSEQITHECRTDDHKKYIKYILFNIDSP